MVLLLKLEGLQPIFAVANPEVALLSSEEVRLMIRPEDYKHPLEDDALYTLKKMLVMEDSILDYYSEVVVPQKRIDLLGKTVKASETQYHNLYLMLESICKRLGVRPPDLFIYEDFYYGADIDGVENPWIEISAKTVSDFGVQELMFILGRQIGRIQAGHLRYRIIIEQFTDMIQASLGSVLGSVATLGIPRTALRSYQLVANKWLRISNLSADACGYLVAGGVEPAIRAIIKEVLNSPELASKVNISSFMKQAKSIDERYDVFSRLARLRQDIPYAPYRIKELIRFASSDRGKNALPILNDNIVDSVHSLPG